MTPRTQSSPPAHSVSGEEEERPKHTSEIGTLKKLPNKETAWLGSSSGVYFANTVRQAFSTAFAASQGLPPNEDILTGEDAEGRSYNGPILTGPSATDQFPQLLLPALGKLPDRKLGLELVTAFFKAWHPILPFLHGPSFLKDMESLYQGESATTAVPATSIGRPEGGQASDVQAQTSSLNHLDARKMVAFQLIINIAALDRSDIQLPAASRINSTVDVTRIAGVLAVDHSLITIQTLLAAQLYLCATLAIRAASTVGGIIIKLIFHAGLHRCPLRYAHLSPEDCEIRKRIFWSAYALDRHCALSLGDPNTIQDNDIDVCLSGSELHKAAPREFIYSTEQQGSGSRQAVGGAADATAVDDEPQLTDEETDEGRSKKLLREAALISFVQWARLIGRIIDIFHKSVNHRYPNDDTIVYLTSDIETWWNDLPSFFSDPDNAEPEGQAHLSRFASFFKILYHRLHLLMSRPRLSLDQSTPQFQHGLSICIRASRNIVAGLKEHQRQGQSMFLPGLLSATWMSGLIIAFACQLGKYPKNRACSDIHSCLGLLSSMNPRWYTVGNCHKVLSVLLSNIQSRKANANGHLSVLKPEMPTPAPEGFNDYSRENNPRPNKRRQTKSAHDMATELDRENWSPRTAAEGASSSTLSSPNFTVPTTTIEAAGKDAKHASNLSSWAPNFANKTPNTTDYKMGGLTSPAAAAANPDIRTSTSGTGLYTPSSQTMIHSQSNNGIPELPYNAGMGNVMDDPVFWDNLDFNQLDIFGSAMWETMTGPYAPGWETGGGLGGSGGAWLSNNGTTASGGGGSFAFNVTSGPNPDGSNKATVAAPPDAAAAAATPSLPTPPPPPPPTLGHALPPSNLTATLQKRKHTTTPG